MAHDYTSFFRDPDGRYRQPCPECGDTYGPHIQLEHCVRDHREVVDRAEADELDAAIHRAWDRFEAGDIQTGGPRHVANDPPLNQLNAPDWDDYVDPAKDAS